MSPPPRKLRTRDLNEATSRRPRRPLTWLLVAALLVVQMLGLAHRVTHAGHGHPSAAHLGAAAGAVIADPPGHGFFAALFAGHAGERDCDAFDQMSHGDVASASSPVVGTASLPGVVLVFHASWHLAAEAHGFLARGPPRLA